MCIAMVIENNYPACINELPEQLSCLLVYIYIYIYSYRQPQWRLVDCLSCGSKHSACHCIGAQGPCNEGPDCNCNIWDVITISTSTYTA